MNNAQRKYLETRIQNIFRQRKEKALAELEKKYPESTDEVSVTLGDLQKAGIDMSKMTFEVRRGWRKKKDFEIDFMDVPSSIAKQVTEAIANKLGITAPADETKRNKAEEEIIGKLNTEQQKILDKVFLGDTDEALKIIQDLEGK